MTPVPSSSAPTGPIRIPTSPKPSPPSAAAESPLTPSTPPTPQLQPTFYPKSSPQES
jgi:hypothetical protein